MADSYILENVWIFGYDTDGLPALVNSPTFIKDWSLPDQPAVVYEMKHYREIIKEFENI